MAALNPKVEGSIPSRPMSASQPPASIRIRHGLGDASRPITLIEAEGEHDYEHRETLISALDGIDGHLAVELTLCGFVDEFVIAAMLGKAHDLVQARTPTRVRGAALRGALATVDLLGLRDVVCVGD
jgi:hypothetical protein